MRLIKPTRLPPAPIRPGTRDYSQKKYLRKLMESLSPQQHRDLVNLHQRAARWYRQQKQKDPDGIFPKFAHDVNHVLPEWSRSGKAFSVSDSDERRIMDIESHIRQRFRYRNSKHPAHRPYNRQLDIDPRLQQWPGLANALRSRTYRVHLGVVQTAHNRQRTRQNLPHVRYIGDSPKWDETSFSYGGSLFS